MLNINAKNDIRLAIWKKLIISACIGLVVFLILSQEWLLAFTNIVNDYIYQKPSSTDLDIKIIKLDDRTFDELGQYEQWSRKEYADLINILNTEDASPAVIGLDILFTGEKDPDGDAALADACLSAGNVVVGINLESHIMVDIDNGRKRERTVFEQVHYPYEALKNSVSLGFVNDEPDRADNTLRCAITSINFDGTWYDSFSYAIYKKYCEYKGLSCHDYTKDRYQRYRFTYTETAPGSPFDCISFTDVINGKYPASYFKDSIVFVGAYAEGLINNDSLDVPIRKAASMYGVEIHANILDALHKGNLQTDVDKTMLGIIYGILSTALCYFLFSYTLPAGALISVLTLILHYMVCMMVYGYNWYINFFVFPMAVAVTYIAMVIYQYLYERANKAKINKAFKMYVAPQIVDEVSKNGDYKLELGGRNKDIAVMFVDIRGFTTMSEGMRPEDVVDVLNEYFDIITNAIFKNGGTLDKFIGDACMAVFNSPFDLDDYVYRAVCTAWDIADGSKILSPKLMEKFGRTVSYGIGVNCGEAVIGNIGSVFRMDYTAIGDTVNTSSRLESNAKAGQILISEEVYRRLGDRVTVEEIGVIPLKGKSIGINVYNVTGIPGREE